MPKLLSRRYPARAESVRTIRHAVTDTLTMAGLTDADLQFRVSVAITEAAANSVRHAYPDAVLGFIDVRVDHLTPSTVVIAITDHGTGINGHPSPAGAGLGLLLMRAQATTVQITSDTTGTTITLHFAT